MKGGDWDERYGTSPLLWGVAPNRFVEARCRELEPGRALDLACGEGRNALWLAARGWQVTGIDFSTVAIARARAAAHDNELTLALVCDDILTVEIADGAFDLVLLAYVQLPPDERNRLIARAAGAVAGGGTFLLVAHDFRNHADGYGGPKDPSLLWTADEVVGGLAGFTIEEADTALRPVAEAPRPAIDTIVMARRAQ
jgi:SAM-dependent methyltransferase